MSSMRSTFFGLEIGRTGLFVSQRQLDVTAHNIANADTVGYTRQRAATAALDPYSVLMKFAPMERGRVGGGVEVLHVEQIRDKFLDMQIREKNSYWGEWNARAKALSNTEAIFDELSDTGLAKMIAKFFSSMQDIHKEVEPPDLRKNMQINAEMLCDKIHEYYDRLISDQKMLDKEYEAMETKINQIADDIAKYNELIFGYELTGEFANDLRDKRNLLLDELSTLVDIQYGESGSAVPGTPGKLWVTIGGDYLVQHKTVNHVALDTQANTIAGEDDVFILIWDPASANTGNVNYTSGKMMALEKMRDSDSVDDMGIPYMVAQLDILANALATEFNKIHMQGYTMEWTDYAGVLHPSRTGVLFFDQIVTPGATPGDPTTYSFVKAKDLKLSADVDSKTIGNEYHIALSDETVHFPDAANNTQTGNNKIGLELLEMITRKNIGNGTFEQFLSATVVALAVKMDYAEKTYESYDNVSMMLENQRQSISGVSLDEEMTNMITFQHAYNGAARVITSMDECLDKLINGTGRCGL